MFLSAKVRHRFKSVTVIFDIRQFLHLMDFQTREAEVLDNRSVNEVASLSLERVLGKGRGEVGGIKELAFLIDPGSKVH